MSEHRFDTLTRAFTRRTSRRSTISIGSAGIAGAALGGFGLRSAQAQQATPIATPDFSLLMVQTAGATTLAPVDGAKHTLTLTGVSAQTLYFSDRPARVTGTMPTAAFIEAWPEVFASSPPNATLIAHRAAGDDVDVAVVVTLSDPVFDEAAGTLTYQAEILSADRIVDRTFEDAPITAIDAPQEFAEAHLFIDEISPCTACVLETIFTLGFWSVVCSQHDEWDGC